MLQSVQWFISRLNASVRLTSGYIVQRGKKSGWSSGVDICGLTPLQKSAWIRLISGGARRHRGSLATACPCSCVLLMSDSYMDSFSGDAWASMYTPLSAFFALQCVAMPVSRIVCVYCRCLSTGRPLCTQAPFRLLLQYPSPLFCSFNPFHFAHTQACCAYTGVYLRISSR